MKFPTSLLRPLFCSAIALTTTTLSGQTNVVNTVAGSGLQSFSGDGGPATAAGLSLPTYLSLDGNGNLYIADSGNGRIRRVEAGTGIISTFAGGGVGSPTAPATSIQLSGPCGVRSTSSGALLLSDTCISAASGTGGGGGTITASTSRILRVDAGIASAIAGLGSSVNSGEFVISPAAIAVDTAGNIYFTDSYRNRILRIAAAGGALSVFAGGNVVPEFFGDGFPAEVASLSTPTCLTFDPTGNLYVCDSGNHRIRRIDALTRIVSTVAGNGVPGFAGNGGPATAASFNFPMDVAFDTAGHLYVADTQNYQIRRIEAGTGIVSTIAGGSDNPNEGAPLLQAFINRPVALAISPAGRLFYAERNGHRVRAFNIAAPPPAVSLAATPAAPFANEAFTLTATVSPAPASGGTVTFFQGSSTVLGTVSVNASGIAALNGINLAPGAYSFAARFDGPPASVSSPLALTLNERLPAAPLSLTATASGATQVNLAWAAGSPGVVTYNVYAGATPGFVPAAANRIGVTSVTSFTAASLLPATTYYFKVRAQNSAGESPDSNQASAATGPAVACAVTYTVTSQGSTTFAAAFTIRNNGAASINTWRLTWTWPNDRQRLTSAANATWTQSGRNATLRNVPANAVLSPGVTLNGVTVNASYRNTNPRPAAFFLNGTLCQ